MLLGTLLFINAGTQMAKINSTEDILNKYVILSLVLINKLNFQYYEFQNILKYD